MPDDLNSGELLEVSLKELRLRPGLFLKVQGTRQGAPVYEAQFVAAIEGKGVMLTPSGMDSLKAKIVLGEAYVIHRVNGVRHHFRGHPLRLDGATPASRESADAY